MKKFSSLTRNALLVGVLVFIFILLPIGVSQSIQFFNTKSVFAENGLGGAGGTGAGGGVNASGGGTGGSAANGNSGTGGGSSGGGVSGGNGTSNGGPRPGPDTVGGTPDAPGAISPSGSGNTTGGSPSGGNNSKNSNTSSTGATSPAAAKAQQDFLTSIQTVYGATSQELSTVKQDIADFNRIEHAYGPEAKQQIINKLATYDQPKAQEIQRALADFLAASPGTAQEAAAPRVINAVLAAASPQDLRNIVAAFSQQPNDVTQAFVNSISPQNRPLVQQAARDYFSQNPAAQQSLASAFQSTIAKLVADGVPVSVKNLIANPTFANFIALVGTQVLNIPGTDPASFNTKTLTVTRADGTIYQQNIATADGGIIAAFATAGISLPPGVGAVVGAAITQAVAAIGDATVSKILAAVPGTGAQYDVKTATLVTSVNGEVTGNLPVGFNVAQYNADIQNGTVKLSKGKITEADLSKYSGPAAGGPGKHASIDDAYANSVASVGSALAANSGNTASSPWVAGPGKIRVFAVFNGAAVPLNKFVPKQMSTPIASMVVFGTIESSAPASNSSTSVSGAGSLYQKFINLIGWGKQIDTGTAQGGNGIFGGQSGDFGKSGASSGNGSVQTGDTGLGICVRPRITSVQTISARIGLPFQYKLTATGGAPLTLSADTSSLPNGFTFSLSTGLLTGTFASNTKTGSSFKVSVAASNPCGQDSFKLDIRVDDQNARGLLGALLYNLMSFWGLNK